MLKGGYYALVPKIFRSLDMEFTINKKPLFNKLQFVVSFTWCWMSYMPKFNKFSVRGLFKTAKMCFLITIDVSI